MPRPSFFSLTDGNLQLSHSSRGELDLLVASSGTGPRSKREGSQGTPLSFGVLGREELCSLLCKLRTIVRALTRTLLGGPCGPDLLTLVGKIAQEISEKETLEIRAIGSYQLQQPSSPSE